MPDTYWLYNWLDARGIRTTEDAGAIIANKEAQEDLVEQAITATAALPTEAPSPYSLVAARDLDLSGNLGCPSSGCRRRQVDSLFRRSWHYFDTIVVADGVAEQAEAFHASPAKLNNQWLVGHIDVALYLRSMGAANLVSFRKKPGPCMLHLEKHAANAGLPNPNEALHLLATRLSQEAKFEQAEDSVTIEKYPGNDVVFRFYHPSESRMLLQGMSRADVGRTTPDAIRAEMADHFARQYVAALTTDIGIAREQRLPIGAASPIYHYLLDGSTGSGTGLGDTAFALHLPVLDGVPIETLLRIRVEEADSFLRFRDALQAAVKERLRTSPLTDAVALAEEIRLDLIEPELNSIRSKLHAIERSLSKKSALGIALSGLTTVCGLLAGIPPAAAVTAGVTALSSATIATGFKDLDRKEEVRLSDMFFLWKAIEHAH